MMAGTAYAHKSGAAPGYSGGPAANGENCIFCHTFYDGSGSVVVLNAPPRYRAGAVYDLLVRIRDSSQVAAGFEISAENLTGHRGTFEITDSVRTQKVGSYVTHTMQGYADSLAYWASLGNEYTYSFAWRAPTGDEGRVTFFVSGNAVNNAQALEGDHYYFEHAVSTYAVPGDHDADEDVDLKDLAAFLNCFDDGAGIPDAACLFCDLDGDDYLTLGDAAMWSADVTGPTAVHPGGYRVADEVRGGLLYDHWMRELGVNAPPGSHPLYPPSGPQSGAVTFRCKECHGWDYKGAAGAYGSDPAHATGIAGVFGTSRTPQEIFELLKASPAEMPGLGHDMDAYGMTDEALWDVTRMVLTATVDTGSYILPNGVFLGVPLLGRNVYEGYCFYCHGEFGDYLNFGTVQNPQYVGTVADANPWELLHKVRFGHPGSAMIRLIQQNVSAQNLAHLGAYCASLPP